MKVSTEVGIPGCIIYKGCKAFLSSFHLFLCKSLRDQRVNRLWVDPHWHVEDTDPSNVLKDGKEEERIEGPTYLSGRRWHKVPDNISRRTGRHTTRMASTGGYVTDATIVRGVAKKSLRAESRARVQAHARGTRKTRRGENIPFPGSEGRPLLAIEHLLYQVFRDNSI